MRNTLPSTLLCNKRPAQPVRPASVGHRHPTTTVVTPSKSSSHPKTAALAAICRSVSVPKRPAPRRTLTIRPERQYHALQAARQREGTKLFRQEYARRAGIEGTISRGIRVTRLRRTRYIGLARVRLAHTLTAVALNALRLGEWFLETARAKTRITPFARLMAATATT